MYCANIILDMHIASWIIILLVHTALYGSETRTLLFNILCRKANWIGHILRRNCLLHYAIEGQMTEVKGIGKKKNTAP